MTDRRSDPDCIFCKIVRGEIPSAKVIETDAAIAFLDINPINRGHILVIPREHAVTLAELSEEQSAHIGSLLPGLCRAVRTASKADGFNLVVNGGTVAGQTVGHCHFHIIPRFQGDPVHWPWPPAVDYEGDGLEKMRSSIERELGLSGRSPADS